MTEARRLGASTSRTRSVTSSSRCRAPTGPGIVAAVSQRLFEHRANIEESQQFSDHRTGRYFMRVRFATPVDGSTSTGGGASSPLSQRSST